MITKTHFMTSIGAKSIDLSLHSEGKRMSIAEAHLDDLIEDFLDPCRFRYGNLIHEDSISETKLSLTVISEGVELASPGDQG